MAVSLMNSNFVTAQCNHMYEQYQSPFIRAGKKKRKKKKRKSKTLKHTNTNTDLNAQ